MCGFYNRDGVDGLNLGFAFLPEFEKKGYGLESTKELMNIAFYILNQTKISAITTDANVGSQRLLEKLGSI